jgi:hypothetical protein
VKAAGKGTFPALLTIEYGGKIRWQVIESLEELPVREKQ